MFKKWYFCIFAIFMVGTLPASAGQYLDQAGILDKSIKNKYVMVGNINIVPKDQGFSWENADKEEIATCARAQKFEDLKYVGGFIVLKATLYRKNRLKPLVSTEPKQKSELDKCFKKAIDSLAEDTKLLRKSDIKIEYEIRAMPVEENGDVE